MLIPAPVDQNMDHLFIGTEFGRTVDTSCKVGEIDIVVGVVGSEQGSYQAGGIIGALLGFPYTSAA